MLKVLESIFYNLFPHLLYKGKPWEKMWLEQERKNFVGVMQIFFGFAAFSYIYHYYTVDQIEGLAPSELWFKYRFGMATISIVAFIFYQFPKLYSIKYYKFPMMIACGIFCYFQAKTSVWYDKVPYAYAYFFIFISATLMRSSLIISAAYATVLVFLIKSDISQIGVSDNMQNSAISVTFLCIIFMRGKQTSDVHLFEQQQKDVENQKKIIELSSDFTNQIQAFLPMTIAKRMCTCIHQKRMSVAQSVNEVLKPQKKQIACIFSDIRGFTKSSNDLDGFVSNSLYPNVRKCTTAIENFGGIPRKIGDLIFAYYDDKELTENINSAFESAVNIYKINEDFNSGIDEKLKIKRFILLSCGESIVGNLSGYDSAIEITAIGSPVNILSRIDELTKSVQLSEYLKSSSIIMTENFFNNISQPKLNFVRIELSKYKLTLRDFPDTENIFILPNSEAMNYLNKTRIEVEYERAS